MEARLITEFETAYDLSVLDYSAIPLGFDLQTTKWRIATTRGVFFLKQHRSSHDVELTIETVALMELVRSRGIPVPETLIDRHGSLVHCGDEGCLHVTEFLVDTRTGSVSDRTELLQGSEQLARLHRVFDNSLPTSRVREPRWGEFSHKHKAAEIQRLKQHIVYCSLMCDFDLLAIDELDKQLEMLPFIQPLFDGMGTVQRRICHGDYTYRNLLFRDRSTVFLVDFRPPAAFFRCYELGRFLFAPERVSVDTAWSEAAMAAATEYRRANLSCCKEDFTLSARAWLIQLLRSTYGISQHYHSPRPFQDELDRYWLQRRSTARHMFFELATLEDELNRIWKNNT